MAGSPSGVVVPQDEVLFLPDISLSGVTSWLEERHKAKRCLARCGPNVTLYMNPGSAVPGLFDRYAFATYESGKTVSSSAHLFQRALDAMKAIESGADAFHHFNFIGNAGSGKSFCNALLLEFFLRRATRSRSSASSTLVRRLRAARRLISVFTTSCTPRNDNGSQCSYVYQLNYEGAAQLTSAKVTCFGLDSSFVVAPPSGSSAFHVLYQLCNGATSEQRNQYRLKKHMRTFPILAKGQRTPPESDTRDWSTSCECMQTLGISETHQDAVLRVLSAILHLSMLTFQRQDARLLAGPATALDTIAHLLGVPTDALTRRLTAYDGDESRPMSTARAAKLRDALSQQLYERAFFSIVAAINRNLGDVQGKEGTHVCLYEHNSSPAKSSVKSTMVTPETSCLTALHAHIAKAFAAAVAQQSYAILAQGGVDCEAAGARRPTPRLPAHPVSSQLQANGELPEGVRAMDADRAPTLPPAMVHFLGSVSSVPLLTQVFPSDVSAESPEAVTVSRSSIPLLRPPRMSAAGVRDLVYFEHCLAAPLSQSSWILCLTSDPIPGLGAHAFDASHVEALLRSAGFGLLERCRAMVPHPVAHEYRAFYATFRRVVRLKPMPDSVEPGRATRFLLGKLPESLLCRSDYVFGTSHLFTTVAAAQRLEEERQRLGSLSPPPTPTETAPASATTSTETPTATETTRPTTMRTLSLASLRNSSPAVHQAVQFIPSDQPPSEAAPTPPAVKVPVSRRSFMRPSERAAREAKAALVSELCASLLSTLRDWVVCTTAEDRASSAQRQRQADHQLAIARQVTKLVGYAPSKEARQALVHSVKQILVTGKGMVDNPRFAELHPTKLQDNLKEVVANVRIFMVAPQRGAAAWAPSTVAKESQRRASGTIEPNTRAELTNSKPPVGLVKSTAAVFGTTTAAARRRQSNQGQALSGSLDVSPFVDSGAEDTASGEPRSVQPLSIPVGSFHADNSPAHLRGAALNRHMLSNQPDGMASVISYDVSNCKALLLVLDSPEFCAEQQLVKDQPSDKVLKILLDKVQDPSSGVQRCRNGSGPALVHFTRTDMIAWMVKNGVAQGETLAARVFAAFQEDGLVTSVPAASDGPDAVSVYRFVPAGSVTANAPERVSDWRRSCSEPICTQLEGIDVSQGGAGPAASSSVPSLADILQQQKDKFPTLSVPWVVEFLATQIQVLSGFSSPDLFRRAVDQGSMDRAYAVIEAASFKFSNPDPYVFACLLKRWLRNLPTPVCPMAPDALLCVDDGIDGCSRALLALPAPEKDLFMFLVRFLRRVVESEGNGMGATELATEMVPCLLHCSRTQPQSMAPKPREVAFLALVLNKLDVDAFEKQYKRKAPSKRATLWMRRGGSADAGSPDTGPVLRVGPEWAGGIIDLHKARWSLVPCNACDKASPYGSTHCTGCGAEVSLGSPGLRPLVEQRKGFQYELGTNTTCADLVDTDRLRLEAHDEYVPYFRDFFYGRPHTVMLGESKSGGQVVMVAVEDFPSNLSSKRRVELRARSVAKAGIRRHTLCCTADKVKKALGVAMELDGHRFYRVKDDALKQRLDNEMLDFESKSIVQEFKFGVLLVRSGQSDENEIYGNEDGTPDFMQFLQLLGDVVELQHHTGYRGGLDTRGSNTTGTHSVFTRLAVDEAGYLITDPDHAASVLASPNPLQRPALDAVPAAGGGGRRSRSTSGSNGTRTHSRSGSASESAGDVGDGGAPVSESPAINRLSRSGDAPDRSKTRRRRGSITRKSPFRKVPKKSADGGDDSNASAGANGSSCDIPSSSPVLSAVPSALRSAKGPGFPGVRSRTDSVLAAGPLGAVPSLDIVQVVANSVAVSLRDSGKWSEGDESPRSRMRPFPVDIMFHVMTMLPFSANNPQQLHRKRHIGNDVCVFVFMEDSDVAFDPACITSNFNHVFIVVSPWKREVVSRRVTHYQVQVVSKAGTRPWRPFLNSPHWRGPGNAGLPAGVFRAGDELRHWLLVKAVNGERAAMYSRDFSFKDTRTRQEHLTKHLKEYRNTK